jgi:hypothetical protein
VDRSWTDVSGRRIRAVVLAEHPAAHSAPGALARTIRASHTPHPPEVTYRHQTTHKRHGQALPSAAAMRSPGGPPFQFRKPTGTRQQGKRTRAIENIQEVPDTFSPPPVLPSAHGSPGLISNGARFSGSDTPSCFLAAL